MQWCVSRSGSESVTFCPPGSVSGSTSLHLWCGILFICQSSCSGYITWFREWTTSIFYIAHVLCSFLFIKWSLWWRWLDIETEHVIWVNLMLDFTWNGSLIVDLPPNLKFAKYLPSGAGDIEPVTLSRKIVFLTTLIYLIGYMYMCIIGCPKMQLFFMSRCIW